MFWSDLFRLRTFEKLRKIKGVVLCFFRRLTHLIPICQILVSEIKMVSVLKNRNYVKMSIMWGRVGPVVARSTADRDVRGSNPLHWPNMNFSGHTK